MKQPGMTELECTKCNKTINVVSKEFNVHKSYTCSHCGHSFTANEMTLNMMRKAVKQADEKKVKLPEIEKFKKFLGD